MNIIKFCSIAIIAVASVTTAQAEVLTEGFDEPFAEWENRWFGTESNAYNYYVSEWGDSPSYRGHESVTGMWLSDGDSYRDGGNYGEIHITFNQAFGASLTAFSMDVASALREDLGLAPTLTFFDISGNVIDSFLVRTSPVVSAYWVPEGYFNYAVTSANGIGGFSFVGHSQGSIIVDNLSATVAAVPEPSSWALMMIGAGMVGAMARRRKNIAAA
ncbi:PEPxxWA-CTERM sorting domain-containing protein [Methylobacillus sp.]|uniref:PEPxxWA-CTERM sorting domain-containing protein n=1 Tax=Methylobacillus sp. TaxID=56818 RepID=UPI002FE3CAE1